MQRTTESLIICVREDTWICRKYLLDRDKVLAIINYTKLNR